MYFIGKIASFSHFKPTFAKLLHKRDYWGLIWHPRAPLKVPVGLLDLERHYFWVYVSLGGVIWRKIKNLPQKSDFEAVLQFKLIFFIKYAQKSSLQRFTQSCCTIVTFQGSSWMSIKHLLGILVKQFGQSRLKMAKISYFPNEIHLKWNIWDPCYR